MAETISEEAQKLDLVVKDFKIPVLNMLKKLRKTMHKETKEISRKMSHQIENINKEKL